MQERMKGALCAGDRREWRELAVCMRQERMEGASCVHETGENGGS